MKQLKCCKLNFMQWRIDPKYAIILLFLVADTWFLFHGFRDYARDLGYPMRPWLLPLLPGMQDNFTVMMMAFVLLIADAPFRTKQQQFVLQRVGKRAWIQGQLLYLLLASFVFAALLWVLSWIFQLPELEWGTTWGPAIQTAAQTGAHGRYTPSVLISYSIIKNATPIEATLWTFFMLAGVCFLMGEIVTLLNLWTKSGIGTALVTVFVMLSYFIRVFSNMTGFHRFLLWISPVSWVDRSMMERANQNLPSYGYAAGMTVGLSILLAVIIVGTIHKCNLETDKE